MIDNSGRSRSRSPGVEAELPASDLPALSLSLSGANEVGGNGIFWWCRRHVDSLCTIAKCHASFVDTHASTAARDISAVDRSRY